MKTILKLYQIDAFTDRIFSGNPAAVCPLEEWLPDVMLQSIAAENNLSETAFFVGRAGNFELRWFKRMLKIYYVLADVIDEAATLIEEAGARPIEKLNSFDVEDGEATLQRWNAILDRQKKRLLFLSEMLVGQEHLEIIDPGLKKRLEAAIGDKASRVGSLYQLGASLVFRDIFPGLKTMGETSNYVLAIAGVAESDTSIDMEKIKTEIVALRANLEGYRGVVVKLVSSQELASLSCAAREETDLLADR